MCVTAVAQACVSAVLDKLASRLEALLARKTFTQLGGLALERDMRSLVRSCSLSAHLAGARRGSSGERVRARTDVVCVCRVCVQVSHASELTQRTIRDKFARLNQVRPLASSLGRATLACPAKVSRQAALEEREEPTHPPCVCACCRWRCCWGSSRWTSCATTGAARAPSRGGSTRQRSRRCWRSDRTFPGTLWPCWRSSRAVELSRRVVAVKIFEGEAGRGTPGPAQSLITGAEDHSSLKPIASQVERARFRRSFSRSSLPPDSQDGRRPHPRSGGARGSGTQRCAGAAGVNVSGGLVHTSGTLAAEVARTHRAPESAITCSLDVTAT